MATAPSLPMVVMLRDAGRRVTVTPGIANVHSSCGQVVWRNWTSRSGAIGKSRSLGPSY